MSNCRDQLQTMWIIIGYFGHENNLVSIYRYQLQTMWVIIAYFATEIIWCRDIETSFRRCA